MTARRVRVLLVDDSPFVRRAFLRVLGDNSLVTIVGEAGDGEQALALCRETRPDVVLLDLNMPVLDGLGVLKVLRRELPQIAVVVVSAAAQRGAQMALAALEAGAFDLVDKASVSLMRLHELGRELIEKIRAAAASSAGTAAAAACPVPGGFQSPELLVMAASTGGPLALLALLRRLPKDFPVPVVVVQHIPDSFAQALAQRIQEESELPALAVSARTPLQPGTLYFPFGARDFEVERRGVQLSLVQRSPQPGTPHVPSADALFHSAARVCGARAWSVLLTGMGVDGAAGTLAIAQAGGLTLAQDQASSAVWGMPKAAIDLGGARAVLPLHEMASYLSKQLEAVSVVAEPRPEVGP